MLIWHKDIELSKYSKYKAKNGLSENGTSSECAHVACSLTGVLLGGLHLLASTCMCLYWLCVHFRTAQVVSCHGRDTRQISLALCKQADLKFAQQQQQAPRPQQQQGGGGQSRNSPTNHSDKHRHGGKKACARCEAANAAHDLQPSSTLVTTVTSHPSLVTPAHVYSQSRPHPNTP